MVMGILVKNLCDGECVNYSFIVLIGEVVSCFNINDKITLYNHSNGTTNYWPVRNSQFKIMIQLQPGNNNLLLHCRKHSLSIKVNYTPMQNTRKIRLVYIKCKDSEGKFQAPPNEDNSVASACKRISLAAQMIQTLTAEKLAEHGFEKKTFSLEEDCRTGVPICHVFTSQLTTEQALNLSEEQLWNHYAKELMASPLSDKERYKFLAFVSFTRYCNPLGRTPQNHKDVLKLTQGHVALGGGGLALFGTGCLHTWASCLQEIVSRFTDHRIIDRKHYMDDSANRKMYWACYSTGIGATLHELGHTFDLGHSADGIMGRGFDDMHKFFSMDSWPRGFFAEKISVHLSVSTDISWSPPAVSTLAINKDASTFDIKEKDSLPKPQKLPHIEENFPLKGNIANCSNVNRAFWSRSSAVLLNFHKWLNPSFPTDYMQKPVLDGTTITSLYGIRIIEFRTTDGMYFGHWEYLEQEGPREIKLNYPDVSKILPAECTEFDIVVEDEYGNILKSTMNNNNW